MDIRYRLPIFKTDTDRNRNPGAPRNEPERLRGGRARLRVESVVLGGYGQEPIRVGGLELTDGGFLKDGIFRHMLYWDTDKLEELFRAEVFRLLSEKGLIRN